MDIVFAILAKDKGHCLPLYLKCLYNQNYPKKNIHLYIKTNDNTDNTVEVLDKFVEDHGEEYGSVYYDKNNISEELKNYSSHHWNTFRFKILGDIRQKSIDHAIKLGAHYFVVDCDNYIVPDTLLKMHELKDIGVIAPMLDSATTYSNYHYDIDSNGYLKYHESYYKIRNREITGIFPVKVCHCTYFISNKFLNKVSYDDNTYRYEYVIFSDVLRKNNIDQYIDNRNFYGFLDFNTNEIDFKLYLLSINHWLKNFYPLKSFISAKNHNEVAIENNLNEKILIISPQAGFANRIRSICSAIVLGKYLNRKVYHAWIKVGDNHSHLQHVRDMQSISFENIFKSGFIEKLPFDINIDVCLSEWLPGEFWYNQQSSAYRRFGNNCSIERLHGGNGDQLLDRNENVILLETGHMLRLSQYENIWDKEMTDVYNKYFKFLDKFTNRFNTNVDIGVCLRFSSEFLSIYPDAYVGEEELISWINKIKENNKSMLIFSDTNKIKEEIQTITNCCLDKIDTNGLEKWEEYIAEFYIIAKNCKKIYGTKHSSFAEEASKYGNVEFAYLLED